MSIVLGLCRQCGKSIVNHVYAGHAYDFPSTEVIHAQAYQTHMENATMQVERGKAPIVITLSVHDALLLKDALRCASDTVDPGNRMPDSLILADQLRDEISRALSSSD